MKSTTIQFPGTKIKPEFDEEQAKQVLYKLYGISTLEICSLNSYDDINFHVYAEKWVQHNTKNLSIFSTCSFDFHRSIKNTNIKSFCAEGYVLKILNSFDSKKIPFVEGSTALSLFLSKCIDSELWWKNLLKITNFESFIILRTFKSFEKIWKGFLKTCHFLPICALEGWNYHNKSWRDNFSTK